MLPIIMGALRRSMRRHQGVPDRAPRLPMWRLLGGELLWAFRQVLAAPWVLGGLLLGFIGALAVLGAAAPGPSIEPPLRVLVAVAAGLLLAAGARAATRDATGQAPISAPGEVPRRPMTAATIIAASASAVVLTVWLLYWLGTSLL